MAAIGQWPHILGSVLQAQPNLPTAAQLAIRMA
jgi:hypothetical protein